jgi:predicted negative regulator of RcsB-dependent stress response
MFSLYGYARLRAGGGGTSIQRRWQMGDSYLIAVLLIGVGAVMGWKFF